MATDNSKTYRCHPAGMFLFTVSEGLSSTNIHCFSFFLDIIYQMKKSYVCVLYWEKFCSCCLPTDYWTHFQLWDYNFNNYNFSAFSCPWTNFFFFLSKMINKDTEQHRQPSRRSPLQGRSCVLHRGYAKTYTAWIPQNGSGDKVVFSLVYGDLSSFSESFDDVM